MHWGCRPPSPRSVEPDSKLRSNAIRLASMHRSKMHRSDSASLNVAAEAQLTRMWIEIGLRSQVVDAQPSNMVAEQGQRHDEGHAPAPMVIDDAQELGS